MAVIFYIHAWLSYFLFLYGGGGGGIYIDRLPRLEQLGWGGGLGGYSIMIYQFVNKTCLPLFKNILKHDPAGVLVNIYAKNGGDNRGNVVKDILCVIISVVKCSPGARLV
mgnify:FL=1